MEMALMIVGGLAGLVGGFFSGMPVGRFVKGRPLFIYWLAGFGVFVVGVAISTIGFAMDWTALALFGAGLVGGGLTGMKYGSGKVPLVVAPRDESAPVDAE